MDMTIVDTWIDTHVPSMQGWTTPEKGRRMARLVIDHQVINALELGVFGGRSLLCMAKAMEQRGSGIATGADPWHVSASVEGTNDPENDKWWRELNHEDIYRGFIQLVLAHHLTKHCQWHRCKSDTAARYYNPATIDLIHQDSNHSEEVSTAEVELYWPLVKPHGIWVMDDVKWPTTQKAQRLLNERGCRLLEDHGEWRIYQKGP